MVSFRRYRCATVSTIVCTSLIGAGLVLMPQILTAQDRGGFMRGPQSVSPVAEKLIDAVVNIATSQIAKGPKGVPLPSVPEGSPFEEFFEDFFNRRGGGTIQRKVSSLGSGFVIDGKKGLVVTNNHVIADADEIIINFSDGKKLKVDKIIGKDPKTDLALLKVTPKSPLVDVSFGSSSDIKVGDWVMAIGNPFGLGGSVTLGIISAKQRDINSGPYDEYLQTDAAINRGNSGGPLFNMNGEVVGVNTAIISPTGGSIGIGFAVPSNTVVNVIEQLQKFGEIRRGWLGVNIQNVGADIASSLGVEADKGALVSAVDPKSPAAEAGIKAGDVIVKFDGKDVSTMRGLPRMVAQTPVGKSVKVDIVRGGKPKTVDVVLGRLAEEVVDAGRLGSRSPSAPKEQETKSIIGLKLSLLTDDLRKKYKIGTSIEGVIVVGVDPNSAAAEKSVVEGDVIIEAAQEKVTSPADVSAQIDKVKKSGRRVVLLRIENAKGELRFVAVPLK